jgi:hypothetical protein
MKTPVSRKVVVSMLLIVLMAALSFIFGGSGFEPALLAALLITFMCQMSYFMILGFHDDEQLSSSLGKWRHHAGLVGGTAVSVMLTLSIILWKLASVNLRQ